MRIITKDDIIDIYYRLSLKGFGFWASKLTFNESSRTQSSFNATGGQTSNWWNIPEIRSRWNEKITGNPLQTYPEYVFEKYLKGRKDIKILSPGAGVCSNELRFAAYPSISEITCIDLANKPLEEAKKLASDMNFSNMHFIKGNANEMKLPTEYYDMVMFNASLHHLKDVENLLVNTIMNTLKADGILLINEYTGPNRLQWSKAQLQTTNELLKTIVPEKYKIRFRSSFKKTSVSGSGILRMIMSDPSEAIDSESIIPSLKKAYIALEEKHLGGNILMLLLKDIAHHFKEEDVESMNVLEKLIHAEDEFLKTEKSNNIFGIYRKNVA